MEVGAGEKKKRGRENIKKSEKPDPAKSKVTVVVKKKTREGTKSKHKRLVAQVDCL